MTTEFHDNARVSDPRSNEQQRSYKSMAVGAGAAGAMAIGTMAISALAVGAVAVGVLAIGHQAPVSSEIAFSPTRD